MKNLSKKSCDTISLRTYLDLGRYCNILTKIVKFMWIQIRSQLFSDADPDLHKHPESGSSQRSGFIQYRTVTLQYN